MVGSMNMLMVPAETYKAMSDAAFKRGWNVAQLLAHALAPYLNTEG